MILHFNGSAHVYYVRTYITGTGKSHFRALISGKDRPASRQSTALATEAEQVIPVAYITRDFEEEMVEFHRSKSGSKVKWLVVGSKKLSLLIAKTIHNQTKGRYKDFMKGLCLQIILYTEYPFPDDSTLR